MRAKHDQSLNYFCSRMSFKNKCTTHFNWIRMSLDKIQSPRFALQLGFLSICAMPGFTGLKKHYVKCKSAGAAGQKGNVISLWKLPCIFVHISSLYWIWISFYSLLPWTETVQLKHNMHCFCFHLASEMTWDWVLFFRQCNLEACTATHYEQKGHKLFRHPAQAPPCFISLLRSHTWTPCPGLLLLYQTTCNEFNTKQTTFGWKVLHLEPKMKSIWTGKN